MMAAANATTIPPRAKKRLGFRSYKPVKCKNCDQVYDTDEYDRCPYCSG